MKKYTKISVFAILGIFLAGILYFFLNNYHQINVSPKTAKRVFFQPTPTPTPDPFAPFGVLLLGYGGGGHDGGFLTDTIILAYIKPKQKQIYLISIPRDIYIALPLLENRGIVYLKINAAYAYGKDQKHYLKRPEEYKGEKGGGNLAKYAISQVTGITPKHFIALSFDGFIKSIDALGGVTVDVPYSFTDDLYPIEEEKENTCGKTPEEIEEVTATLSGELLERQFPCRYETISFTKGVETMDGARALKFVRSRKSKTYGGDFNRSKRQLALLKAIRKKIFSINFIPKSFNFIQSLTSDLDTDISLSESKTYLSLYKDLSSYTLQTIQISTENVLKESISSDGQYILIPKQGQDQWKNIHDYIQSQINTP